jgi:hypothetical protein
MDKDKLFNINPTVSTLCSYLVGLLLVGDLTASEQSALGNWIFLVGQTLITHGASQAIIENRISGDIININSKENKKIYNPLIYDIQSIREILKETNPNHAKNAIHILQEKVDKLLKDLEQIKKEL